MRQIQETINYIFEYYRPLQELIEAYPLLTFTAITPNIIAVSVPPEARPQFLIFERQVRRVGFPELFGLDIFNALQEANISQFHNYPFGELRGSGILIGFVDTGIEYTNPFFQYEDRTTRIVAIWDQTIEGNPPALYPYGTEYTREQINLALQSEDPLSIVPSTDDIGHGTFLAGIAAGYDRSAGAAYVGGAPESMLVVVKLAPAPRYLRDFYLIRENAIAYDTVRFMQGVNYLFEVASRENRPLVICVGIGGNTGAHDGRTRVELFLNEYSKYRDVVVVVPAGNEANLGHHFRSRVEQDGASSFEVNVAEGERGIFMQVWASDPDKLTISVISPLGRVIEKIPLSFLGEQRFSLPLERTQILIAYDFTGIYTTGQNITVRLVDPTPGLWQFTIYGEYILNGVYNVWLPREGFINPATRFLQPDPFTTVNIPGTESNVICVGAYDDQDGSIYISSGRGPTRTQGTKPDFVAPGVNVLGPALGGGLVAATGTSISTAIAAAASALLIEWINQNAPDITINTRIARSIFIRGARRTPGVVYPNPTEGYGKLDLINSILLI